ncbi:MAG: hypothetical protein JNL18_20135 [Planctomycetaceae bacterium]|nr:hypothetical protein [Planctomycetaceae bacterium]
MKPIRVVSLILPLLAGALVARPGHGELTVVANAEGEPGLTVYKMSVTPAAEPEPALALNLIPRADAMRNGNAALFYLRSFAEGNLSSAWKGIFDDYGRDEVEGSTNAEAWYSIERQLDGATLAKARTAASRFDNIVEQFVARGSVRRDCDWGHHVDELEGSAMFAMLLPEVQESRSLARALMLRTRIAIADRDDGAAIEQLRMAYQLARHTAQASFLISSLVGIAEANMANDEVIELIAAKDSPNLYWALAELPRPFIDLVPAVRMEMGIGLRTFPFLIDPENTEHSPQEWARLIASGVEEAQNVLGSGAPGLDEASAQAGVAGLAIILYPDAKRRLMAGGMEAHRVEQMPVGQVLAIDAAREYRRIGDEFEKQWYLPYAAARNRQRESDALIQGSHLTGGLGRLLASMLMPAVNSIRSAGMRLERQLNALQAIEAIRMHAAQTGKLPATLEEITIVPVPLNPVTGKPFVYRLDGETAILELPFSDKMNDYSSRFEITLAK